MKIRISATADLLTALGSADGPHYVYVLCEPVDGTDRPFYVGIGQGQRIFAHEDEARESQANSKKLQKIREIWEKGEEVARYLDGFHQVEPWNREAELINEWGLLKDGTGILTNEQRYAKTGIQGSIVLRKYAEHGNTLPPNFKSRNMRLLSGPRKPKGEVSVYGKIYAKLDESPGVTGEELVELLLSVDFSDNKSAYTQSGEVSLPWLAKYIDGGFYKKNLCIQHFCDDQDIVEQASGG